MSKYHTAYNMHIDSHTRISSQNPETSFSLYFIFSYRFHSFSTLKTKKPTKLPTTSNLTQSSKKYTPSNPTFFINELFWTLRGSKNNRNSRGVDGIYLHHTFPRSPILNFLHHCWCLHIKHLPVVKYEFNLFVQGRPCLICKICIVHRTCFP